MARVAVEESLSARGGRDSGRIEKNYRA